jgi:hypothetical protein
MFCHDYFLRLPVYQRNLAASVADPDPGFGIRDRVLFEPWIRDPE